MSPTLSVEVLDSISETAITSATVALYPESDVASAKLEYNATTQIYELIEIELLEGRYVLTIIDENYHSAVIREFNFRMDTSCGGINDWELTVYLYYKR